MTIFERIKSLFSATKQKAAGLKEVKLKNDRVALVDKHGNFKGFKK